MDFSAKLTSQEDETLRNLSDRDWYDLEDTEQLEYSLLLFRKRGIINTNSIHAIRTKIENYRTSSDEPEDNSFDRYAYEYLYDLTTYKPYEYMYLAWLNQRYSWSSKVNNPHAAAIADSITLSSFKTTYGWNEQRVALISLLEHFITVLKQQAGTNTLRLIVGGSFATNKQHPCDIDFAIIISDDLIKEVFDFDNTLYRLNNNVRKELDFYFIKDLSTSTSFHNYNIFSRLSNESRYKEKSVVGYYNNEFIATPLISIEM